MSKIYIGPMSLNISFSLITVLTQPLKFHHCAVNIRSATIYLGGRFEGDLRDYGSKVLDGKM